jgi:catechol 2,3-dioxygenase-like lactoylglutathione lyase family enzyme
MVKGVSTVWLPVDDLQRSLQFYGDTLGLKKKDQDGDDWAELELDGLTIGLNGRESETPGGEGGAVIAFRADGSIEDEVERLKGAGVDFADGIADRPWGRVAAFHDPDGNVLELYEPPSD